MTPSGGEVVLLEKVEKYDKLFTMSKTTVRSRRSWQQQNEMEDNKQTTPMATTQMK